jgi:hypothetical protein
MTIKGMTTFDDIEIRRPDLANSYLALLKAQPGRPIALFAPRRVGKTYFLDRDLTPAAEKLGLLPVYADLWLNRSSPLDAINHALEEALDDVNVPRSSAGKIAKTPVKKVGALSASLEFGEEPARRQLPEKPELRMDALISRLANDSGKQILLMLDEIQALGQSTSGDAAIATVRAVLQKHNKKVFAAWRNDDGSRRSDVSIRSTAHIPFSRHRVPSTTGKTLPPCPPYKKS